MKKYTIFYIMLMSVLMMSAGCKDNPKSQTQSSLDISVPESEQMSETTDISVTQYETELTVTTTASTIKSGSEDSTESTETETTSVEITVPEISESVDGDDIIENELPVIDDSEIENYTENSELPTDSKEEVSDDIIELPFVPVE